MKKTYIKPQINVMTIETHSIICTSSLSIDGTTSGGGITEGESRDFDLDFFE